MRRAPRLTSAACCFATAILLVGCQDDGSDVAADGSTEQGDGANAGQASLSEVVLKAEQFPDGFVSDDGVPFEADFDAVSSDAGLTCPAGVDATEFTKGVVQGDVVRKGDVDAPPFAGGGSIAARVPPATATRWIEEWATLEDTLDCLRAESNVDGDVERAELAIDGVRVVTIRQSGSEASLVLSQFAANDTIGLLILVFGGQQIDDDVVAELQQTFAERIAA